MKGKLTLFIVLATAVLWPQGRAETGETLPSPYIDYPELKEMMGDESLMIIDVRTAAEYESGHIPGAVNIPYDTMPESMPEGSKEKQIVLYCRSGNRSGVARGILNEAGYSQVRDFGGVGNWKDALE